MNLAEANLAVIIPTRNRPDDLKDCLQSLVGQSLKPAQVIVCDSSVDDRSRKVVEDFSLLHSGSIYLKSPKAGLTFQKNLAVERVGPEVEFIQFLDDDVVLEPDYLERIMQVFASDESETVAGVSGVSFETLLPRDTHRILTVYRRLFLFESRRGGRVLCSGLNIPVSPDVTLPTRVEWLFGCAAYRRDVFSIFSFDEDLAGYGLMEDVDFSYRVGKKYSLYVDPRARLLHKRAQDSRPDEFMMGNLYVANRYHFVKKNMRGYLRLLGFTWNTVGYVIQNFIFWLVKGHSSALQRLRGAMAACLVLIGRDSDKTHS